MKVTSDACIFGAYISVPKDGRILDIGAGTGILSLMLAQRSNEPITIDAVEIDREAATQAADNVKNSPWSNRIRVHSGPIQDFNPPSPLSYEKIICNPPFYDQKSTSKDPRKKVAWHTGSLTHSVLVDLAIKWLSNTGLFNLILPCTEEERFVFLSEEKGLVKQESCYLHHYADRSPNRVFLQFGKQCTSPTTRNLVIYDQQQVYTNECRELLTPYYTSL